MKYYETNNKIKEAYIIMENGDKIPFQLSEETKQEIIKGLSKPEKWKPIIGEIYFYVDSNGILNRTDWRNDFADTWRYRNNMVFKTEEEAMKYKKVFEAICEVCEAYPVDWKNEEQEKHWIEWSYSSKKVNCNYTIGYRIPNVKYASCENFKEKVLEKGISEQDLDWFLMG